MARLFACQPLQSVAWRIWAGVLPLLCVTMLGGCQSDPYQPMSGTVTVDGEPLKKGVITFYPQGEGTTVGGEIIDGQFALDKERGASPGKYRVEINAFRPTGRTEFDIDLNQPVDIEMQYLPARYNNKSTLEVEVLDGQPNEYTFELATK